MDADFSIVSAVICVLQIAQGHMAMSCRRVKSIKEEERYNHGFIQMATYT